MNLFEKSLSSESVYKGKIIDCYKDEVELPNGNHSFREVIKHPGGVCVVALTPENDVIMVEQFRYPHAKVLLEIPAGKLEYGENPEECGKRELTEETGFRAGKFESLGKLLPTPAYCAEVIHMYLATELTAGEKHLDEGEFLETVKIPFAKAVQMVLNNEIDDAKTQLALLKTKALLKL